MKEFLLVSGFMGYSDYRIGSFFGRWVIERVGNRSFWKYDEFVCFYNIESVSEF